MKKLLSIFIFLIICTLGFAQETNSELLKKAQSELNSALEKEDYSKAALLKAEIEKRNQIEEAVANGDYQLAAKLKDKLISNDSYVENKDCIVYFYSGEYIGAIGGYVMSSDIDNIELKAGSIKKVNLKAGVRTFTTNKHETQVELTRNLEPDKIYFIEFNKQLAAHIGYNATLKFVTEQTFIKSTHFKEKFSQGYQAEDKDSITGESKLFFFLNEPKSANTSLEINGAIVINEFAYKAKRHKYSISVSEGEKIVTLINSTLGKNPMVIKSIFRQGHINLSFDKPKYIVANYKIDRIIFTEVTKEEFEQIKAEQINL